MACDGDSERCETGLEEGWRRNGIIEGKAIRAFLQTILGKKKYWTFPWIPTECLSKERESCVKKNTPFSCYMIRTGDRSKKGKELCLLPQCHRVLVGNILTHKLKTLKMWIWYFQIFSYFRKYFQKTETKHILASIFYFWWK